MLPAYLQPGFAERMQKISEQLKANLPRHARSEYEAMEAKAKKEMEEQHRRREEFEKRAAQIGYAAALVEASQKVDAAIAEAKNMMNEAIKYTE